MSKKCKVCGSNNTRLVTGIEIYPYKGMEIFVPDFTKTVCSNCGEEIADSESVEKSIPILRDAQRQIDGFLTSKEIRAIRKSFGLTQDEFSTILGGGEKAFTRYENGKVLQSKPMDNLLRILRKCPDMIDIINNNKGEYILVGQAIYDSKPEISPFNYVISEKSMRMVG